MEEKKQAHLEMIQGVINRLSRNSFLLKGWSVVLVSSLFALSGLDKQIWFVVLALFPALVFWGLDGYFLRQERLFRKLYDHVRKLPGEDIDYSMDRSQFESEVDSSLNVAISKTLLSFHGIILVAIIVVIGTSLFLNGGC